MPAPSAAKIAATAAACCGGAQPSTPLGASAAAAPGAAKAAARDAEPAREGAKVAWRGLFGLEGGTGGEIGKWIGEKHDRI